MKTGDTVTWGVYFTDSRKPITAQFEIVAKPTATKKLAELQADRRLALQPVALRQQLEAEVLQNYRLYSEALVRLLNIHAADKESTVPYGGIVSCLRRLDLEDTALFTEAASKAVGLASRHRGETASGLPAKKLPVGTPPPSSAMPTPGSGAGAPSTPAAPAPTPAPAPDDAPASSGLASPGAVPPTPPSAPGTLPVGPGAPPSGPGVTPPDSKNPDALPSVNPAGAPTTPPAKTAPDIAPKTGTKTAPDIAPKTPTPKVAPDIAPKIPTPKVAPTTPPAKGPATAPEAPQTPGGAPDGSECAEQPRRPDDAAGPAGRRREPGCEPGLGPRGAPGAPRGAPCAAGPAGHRSGSGPGSAGACSDSGSAGSDADTGEVAVRLVRRSSTAAAEAVAMWRPGRFAARASLFFGSGTQGRSPSRGDETICPAARGRSPRPM